MSEKEPVSSSDTYDLMLKLEQLESLREDLEDWNFSNLTEIESALALLVPGASPETQQKRDAIAEMRTLMLDLKVKSRADIEARIDSLNEQLDEFDDYED